MTSGGSRRRECPLPQKVASLRPRASGLLGFAQKLRVLFGGPSLHSSVRLRRTRHSGQKSRRGRRPERCAAPVQSCLSLSELPPPRRERRAAFPGSQVFGTGTLPVGFQGRSALVAPEERNPGSGRCKTGLLPGGGTDDVAALFELRYRIRVVQHAAFQAGQR